MGRAASILVLWAAAYLSYSPLAGLAFHPLGYFFHESGRLTLLLALVMLATGLVRTHFTPRRMRGLLAGRSKPAAVVLASLFGVVTPFCTCSAVPLFIGFVTAGLPLEVAFAFLVAAPMVNEVALVLLVGLCGWTVALAYAAMGIMVAAASAWMIGRWDMGRHIDERVLETARQLAVSPPVDLEGPPPAWPERLQAAEMFCCTIMKWTWPFVLAGIGVGALIHGFVPGEILGRWLGGNPWWSVPAAVLIGVPLYSNAAGVIPVVAALLEKGVALGTCLAFMMAVIGLSLPEIVVLRRVLKPKLLGLWLGTVASGIILVGFVFNLFF